MVVANLATWRVPQSVGQLLILGNCSIATAGRFLYRGTVLRQRIALVMLPS